MRNNKGGMQTASAKYELYCPKCNKPAYRVDERPDFKEYHHFTKKGSVRHTVKRTDEVMRKENE